MTLMYDVAYIDADKKIDVIKDYLDGLEECDIDKIIELSVDLQWFIDNYLESVQE